MKFYNEIQLSPMDLSEIRIKLLSNYPLDKMNVGDIVNIQALEYGQEIVYQIKKLNIKGNLFNLEIKKFVFNKALFDLEVKKQLLNPNIEVWQENINKSFV